MNRKNRLVSLLLALGLLLGVVVTGCSSNDNKTDPVTVLKSFSYSFARAAAKSTLVVPAVATNVKVAAFNSEGDEITTGVKVSPTDLSGLTPDADGNYTLEITVPVGVDNLVVSFYHVDKDTKENIGDMICWVEDVSTIEEGDEIVAEAKEAVEFSVKCYDSDNKEEYNYVVGDKFAVKVVDQDNYDLTNSVGVVYEVDKLALVEGTSEMVYEAIGTGVAEFEIEYNGVFFKDVKGEVEIDLPALESLQICPEGWKVIDGTLCDAAGKPAGTPDFPALDAGKSYTFFVAGFDADKVAYEVTTNDATMDHEPGCVSLEGFTITADKEDAGTETIKVKLNDSTLEATPVVITVKG